MKLKQVAHLLGVLAIVAMPVGAQQAKATMAVAPAPTQKAAPASPAPGSKAAVAAATTIDINSATKEQLMAVKGIGDAYAAKIIAGRPYTSKDQLWRKKVLPKGLYDSVKELLIAKQK